MMYADLRTALCRHGLFDMIRYIYVYFNCAT